MLKDHLARTVSAVCLYRVLLYAQCILSDQENTTILVPSSTGCQETGPSGRMLRLVFWCCVRQMFVICPLEVYD